MLSEEEAGRADAWATASSKRTSLPPLILASIRRIGPIILSLILSGLSTSVVIKNAGHFISTQRVLLVTVGFLILSFLVVILAASLMYRSYKMNIITRREEEQLKLLTEVTKLETSYMALLSEGGEHPRFELRMPDGSREIRLPDNRVEIRLPDDAEDRTLGDSSAS